MILHIFTFFRQKTQKKEEKRNKKEKKENKRKKRKRKRKRQQQFFDLKKHFPNWKPNAGYPTGAKPKRKKEKNNNVTVMHFLLNPPLCNDPRNHAVVVCSDIFFTCLWFMLLSHVYYSCWTVWSGFAIFLRGFYSITATEFMFGIWWLPMFTYFYHSLCVLLFYCFHSWFISFPGAF